MSYDWSHVFLNRRSRVRVTAGVPSIPLRSGWAALSEATQSESTICRILRRALRDLSGRPVNPLFTDLFIYWANRQEPPPPPDPWAERIKGICDEHLSEERLAVRRQGEDRARALLTSKAGPFGEDDLRQFCRDLSADSWSGKEHYDRFMPAFYATLVNRLAEGIDSFNKWARMLWEASDQDVPQVLRAFWAASEVPGAGLGNKARLWHAVFWYNYGSPQASMTPAELREAGGWKQESAEHADKVFEKCGTPFMPLPQGNDD